MNIALTVRRLSLDLVRTAYYLGHVWTKLAGRGGLLDDQARTKYYYDIWKRAADELNAEFSTLPYGFCEVRLGKRVTRICEHLVMLDHHVTLQLARNKPLVHKLLAKHDIALPPYCEFSLYELPVAISFLRSQHSACVVKPAQGSAGGEGVTTNVRSTRELKRAAIYASLYSHSLLIERQIEGDAYRLLYLDGKLIDALKRRPPGVTGDGTSTIRDLIEAENARRGDRAGTSAVRLITIDHDCKATLKQAGLSLNSVPPPGAEITVKTVSNESSDKESKSVRSLVCNSIVQEAGKAAEILGVRLAGVDVLTTDPGIPLRDSGGVIIEVNAAPGIHYHYQINNIDEGVSIAVPILRLLLGSENGKTMAGPTGAGK